MTTKGTILKAIREHCLECCCGSPGEVVICAVGPKCQLFDYRMGKDPRPSRKGRFMKTLTTESNFSLNHDRPMVIDGSVENHPTESNRNQQKPSRLILEVI